MDRFLDPETVGEVLSLIERYGYLFIFIGTMLQSLGLPLPAQTVLLTSGVMAGQGILNPYYAVAFGLLGALAGSQAGYIAGRKGGRPFALRWGRYVRVTPARLDRAEKFFKRHGERTVLVARFIPFLKTFGYLAAGIVRMPRRAFFRNDLLGTAAWAATSVLAGYLASESVMRLIE